MLISYKKKLSRHYIDFLGNFFPNEALFEWQRVCVVLDFLVLFYQEKSTLFKFNLKLNYTHTNYHIF